MQRTVHFNARFLLQPQSGMQRYAREMLSALDAQLAAAPAAGRGRWVALAPAGRIEAAPAWQVIELRQVGRLQGHAWEQTELAWHARAGVLVSLAGSGPLLHRRHVLALHDAKVFAHPECYSARYAAWHRLLRPRLARAAAALVTVSEFSRRELAHHCKVSAARFAVLPNSAEHILAVAADAGILGRWGLRPGHYALTVGNPARNKNLGFAVQAFERAAVAGAQLAVVGSEANDRVFAGARPAARPAVKQLGRVSDAELRALYEHAAVLLFSSTYEGFGVPPLEALLLGCPVIASPHAALPEVLEDAAQYYIDLDDFAAQIAGALRAGRAPRSDSARRVAAKYSWQRSAAGLARLLHAAV